MASAGCQKVVSGISPTETGNLLVCANNPREIPPGSESVDVAQPVNAEIGAHLLVAPESPSERQLATIQYPPKRAEPLASSVVRLKSGGPLYSIDNSQVIRDNSDFSILVGRGEAEGWH
jgi:hypothetical protein